MAKAKTTHVGVYWSGMPDVDKATVVAIEQELREMSRQQGWKMKKTRGWDGIPWALAGWAITSPRGGSDVEFWMGELSPEITGLFAWSEEDRSLGGEGFKFLNPETHHSEWDPNPYPTLLRPIHRE
jgi:hypothetical protein